MFCCLLCDEKRRVTGGRPTGAVCGNCGGAVSEVKVRSMFRFCFIPVCWNNHRRVMCSRCGSQLRRY